MKNSKYLKPKIRAKKITIGLLYSKSRFNNSFDILLGQDTINGSFIASGCASTSGMCNGKTD